MTDVDEKYGQLLKDRREAVNLSQAELAQLANIHRGTVRNAEAGRPLEMRSHISIRSILGLHPQPRRRPPQNADPVAEVLPASTTGSVARVLLDLVDTDPETAVLTGYINDLWPAIAAGRLDDTRWKALEDDIAARMPRAGADVFLAEVRQRVLPDEPSEANEHPEPDVRRIIATNVRTLRKDRGWTQEQAAQRLAAHGINWTVPVWSSMERSAETDRIRSFTAQETAALAATFDVSPDELMASGEAPRRPHAAPLSAAVCRNVRALRLARGWSIRQLAEQCAQAGAVALTQPSLANLERDPESASSRKRREVTVDELYVLAAVFEVSPDRLVSAPTCETCQGAPPAGFACLACGTESKPS